MEAAVGEEKRRILEQRQEMEKSADEIREGFTQREAVLEVGVIATERTHSLYCRRDR